MPSPYWWVSRQVLQQCSHLAFIRKFLTIMHVSTKSCYRVSAKSQRSLLQPLICPEDVTASHLTASECCHWSLLSCHFHESLLTASLTRNFRPQTRKTFPDSPAFLLGNSQHQRCFWLLNESQCECLLGLDQNTQNIAGEGDKEKKPPTCIAEA